MAISPRLIRLLNEAGRVTEKQGGFQHALLLWKAVASQATVEGIDPESWGVRGILLSTPSNRGRKEHFAPHPKEA